MAVGLASCLLFALAGVYAGDYLTGEYLPYFLPAGLSEAWLSGMLSTLFAVYRPDCWRISTMSGFLADNDLQQSAVERQRRHAASRRQASAWSQR
jgi:uncharacterized membrane protein